VLSVIRRRRRRVTADALSGWLCADCGLDTCPFERYMVTDEVWQEAGSVESFLCVACLEDRLDRSLEPADFPAFPLNDDNELDSVRLRVRKGSGRNSEALYKLATAAVVDVGRDEQEVAGLLCLDLGMLRVWVSNARIAAEIRAEIEAEGDA
jgi:hypothetical protein